MPLDILNRILIAYFSTVLLMSRKVDTFFALLSMFDLWSRPLGRTRYWVFAEFLRTPLVTLRQKKNVVDNFDQVQMALPFIFRLLGKNFDKWLHKGNQTRSETHAAEPTMGNKCKVSFPWTQWCIASSGSNWKSVTFRCSTPHLFPSNWLPCKPLFSFFVFQLTDCTVYWTSQQPPIQRLWNHETSRKSI